MQAISTKPHSQTTAAFLMRKAELLGESHGCRTAVHICFVTRGVKGVGAAPERERFKERWFRAKLRDTCDSPWACLPLSCLQGRSAIATKSQKCSMQKWLLQEKGAVKAMAPYSLLGFLTHRATTGSCKAETSLVCLDTFIV